jgi:hypothetical protein
MNNDNEIEIINHLYEENNKLRALLFVQQEIIQRNKINFKISLINKNANSENINSDIYQHMILDLLVGSNIIYNDTSLINNNTYIKHNNEKMLTSIMVIKSISDSSISYNFKFNPENEFYGLSITIERIFKFEKQNDNLYELKDIKRYHPDNQNFLLQHEYVSNVKFKFSKNNIDEFDNTIKQFCIQNNIKMS